MATKQTGLSNETLIVTTGCFSTMASRFASPQVVLPWIYNLLGGPLILVGFLVPSIRLGGLLAQMMIIPGLLKLRTRKWAYVFSLLVSSAVLAFFALVLQEMGHVSSLIFFFLGLLLLGSSTGIAALSMQEVIAKTIPRDRVGRVLSLQVSFGGGVMLAVMLTGLIFFPDIELDAHRYAMMGLAAIASALAAFAFMNVREPLSDVQGRKSAWSEIIAGWGLVRNVPWFRKFVLVRILFLSVGMATPFYSIHAAIEFSKTAHSLTAIVIASGFASMLSTAVWSKVLANTPRNALFRSGILAALAGLIVIIHELRGAPHPLVFMLVFALLQLAVQGLTQATRTYLVFMCPEDERPVYLAVGNAILGIMAILFSGLIGVLAGSVHIYFALGLLIFLALLSSVSTRLLDAPASQ
ncbi:MAG TPA: MFS transporter [Xanthomonadales bacterium]|nr:MFS transporter [Xanthomonadales bacterium]